MKTLKREKLNQHFQNNLLIILFLLFSNLLFSQKFEDYYLTTKTITFKNPLIVVPDSDKVGIFILEKDEYDKEKNIKKLFKQKKAYFFDKDDFIYEIYRDLKKTNFSEEDYNYIFRNETGNTITLRLNEKIKSFYIGFIKVKYYNYSKTSAHKRYPYIKNTDNYELVLIPSFTD